MKERIKVVAGANEVQWLYSQDWVYHDYGNCKRHLQIIFPYKDGMKNEEKYPLILFIPGSAWHKQEMESSSSFIPFSGQRSWGSIRS